MTPSTPNIIPDDLQSIFLSLQTLQTSNPALYTAVVRPNKPPLGIGGFLFDIPLEDEVRLRSQATNYYLENNTAVQDNIAVSPAIITLRGMIAELAMTNPANPTTSSSGTTNPLVPAMMPGMTPQQQQKYLMAQAVVAAAAVAASGPNASLYNYYSKTSVVSGANLTRQTAAFLYFQQLQTGQQLCSVETPWGIYEDCSIIELRIVQEANTKYASNFSVTFQKMRFSGEATIQPGNLAGRTNLQLQPPTQNGNAGLTPTATTLQAAGIPLPTGSPSGGGGD